MEPDNWLWHMYDTVKGSDWLGDQVLIFLMNVFGIVTFISFLDRLGRYTLYDKRSSDGCDRTGKLWCPVF